MEKIEKGVIVMKDGLAWGEKYSDGQITQYGWMHPEDLRIKLSNPEFCLKPTDVTYRYSPYEKELIKGELVLVERKIIVTVKEVK